MAGSISEALAVKGRLSAIQVWMGEISKSNPKVKSPPSLKLRVWHLCLLGALCSHSHLLKAGIQEGCW